MRIISLDQIIEELRLLDIFDEAAHVETDTIVDAVARFYFTSNLKPV